MHYTIYNESNLNMNNMKPLISSFMPFAKKKMGYDQPVSIRFLSDPDNGALPLGKTAYYDPNNLSVTLYTDQRHPKDIMRSLSHELIHHTQNCRGDFDRKPEIGEGYFLNDGYMREKEREAYEKGNMCFREWEEDYKTRKKPLQESIYYTKGDNSKMSYKNWRTQDVNDRLMGSWGYKAPKTEILTESAELEESEEVVEEAEELEEAAKPDFLDLDKDGDEEESMKAAAEDAEELEEEVSNPGEHVGAPISEDAIRRAVREAISRTLNK